MPSSRSNARFIRAGLPNPQSAASALTARSLVASSVRACSTRSFSSSLAGVVASRSRQRRCRHHGHSGYIPDWYSLGCLVTDLGVGVFALLRLEPRTALRSTVRRRV